jgi:hypothetical protein
VISSCFTWSISGAVSAKPPKGPLWLYDVLVLLQSKGSSLAEAAAEFERRHRAIGCEATRIGAICDSETKALLLRTTESAPFQNLYRTPTVGLMFVVWM